MELESTAEERRAVADRIRAEHEHRTRRQEQRARRAELRGDDPPAWRQLEARALALELYLDGARGLPDNLSQQVRERHDRLAERSRRVRDGYDDPGEDDDATVVVRAAAMPTPTLDSLAQLAQTDAAGLAEGPWTAFGRAVPYGSRAHVANSVEGEFLEVFSVGSCARSVAEDSPTMFYEHGRHTVYGRFPIGAPKLSDERDGVHFVAPLVRSWLVSPIRDAIRGGALKGVSIGFQPIDDVWSFDRAGLPHRTIRAARIHELSLTPEPCYAATSVAVRSMSRQQREQQARRNEIKRKGISR